MGILDFLESIIPGFSGNQTPAPKPQVPFDQQMAAKGWHKMPNGTYYQGGNSPTINPDLGATPQPQPTAPPQMAVSPAQPASQPAVGNINQDALNKFLTITRQSGIPDAVAAGQFGIESYHGNDASAKANNNYVGIKVGGNLVKYPSIEENARDYALTVKNILAKKGIDLDKLKNDPTAILNGLQQGSYRYEGSSKNPQQYVDLVQQMPEYRQYSKASS